MELVSEKPKPAAQERAGGIGLRSAFSIFLVLIVMISVFSVTLVTYLQAKQLARNEIRARLLAAAGTAALAIDADRHSRVALDRRQQGMDYNDLQIELRKIQKKIPDARYVYTFRLNKKNQIVFVGDSDNSKNKSFVGEVYSDETETMRAAFVPGVSAVAEKQFASDRWGSWLSGYAPLIRANGTVEGIVGVDISANQVLELEKRYLTVGIISSLIIILVLIPFIFYATHTITGPLRRVSEELKRLREFDLNSGSQNRSRIREVNELNFALESTRVGLKSFKKYVPGDIATALVSSRVEAKADVKKREITLMFTDFEGFTTFAESVAPDVLVQLLNKYFEAISHAVAEYQGTVDKFIGDSVMAFWNAPANIPNHPEQAALAAIKVVDRIRAINAQRAREGQPGLNIRVGIHTGIAMVGNIGHEGRLSYTAIGDAVNMASRIEALNKKYGTSILMSASTAERLGKHFEMKPLEDVLLKGKSKPIAVLELRGVELESES